MKRNFGCDSCKWGWKKISRLKASALVPFDNDAIERVLNNVKFCRLKITCLYFFSSQISICQYRFQCPKKTLFTYFCGNDFGWRWWFYPNSLKIHECIWKIACLLSYKFFLRYIYYSSLYPTSKLGNQLFSTLHNCLMINSFNLTCTQLLIELLMHMLNLRTFEEGFVFQSKI